MHPTLSNYLNASFPASIQNRVRNNYSLLVRHCIKHSIPAMDCASDTVDISAAAVGRYYQSLSFLAQQQVTPLLDAIAASCNLLRDTTISGLVTEGDETAPIFCECLRNALFAEVFEKYFKNVPATFPHPASVFEREYIR